MKQKNSNLEEEFNKTVNNYWFHLYLLIILFVFNLVLLIFYLRR